MAASHMACVRSSARAAHQKVSDSENSNRGEESIAIDVAKELSGDLSVISISNSDDEDISQSIRGANSQGESSSLSRLTSTEIHQRKSHNEYVPPKILSSRLDKIESIEDIERHLDPSLSQSNVVSRLEQRWTNISENLDRLIVHLQECSDEVVDASSNCLASFKESIDVTCDKIDDETKALYNLITKCDALTTKLSIASSFREEIKTLKKSVETLENLYKFRPQPPTPSPIQAAAGGATSSSISASSSSSTNR